MNTSEKINKLMASYYDGKINRKEFEKELKKIGVDALIKFIIEEV